jgi:hypothetical protein
MHKNFYASSLAVLIIGLVAVSQTPKAPPGLNPEPGRSYSVVTIRYKVAPDGTRTQLGERIRYVKANGEFRLTRNNTNDQTGERKPSPVLAGTEDGVYAAAPGVGARQPVSPAANEQLQECFRSVTCLKGQRSFVRTEKLVGLEVYVLLEKIDSPHPIEWIEKSYSPLTGYIPLRTIIHFRDGSEDVNEATKVEFIDVPDNLNDDVRVLPNRKQ